MREFVLILVCFFCIFQCEDKPIDKPIEEPIPTTRILNFHEIEAPETVSVSSQSFLVTLKNTCHDDGNYKSCRGEDYIKCDESFSWVADQGLNQLSLTPQALYPYPPGDYRCLGKYGLGTKTYEIQGPFPMGDFRIIVHQPDGMTLEKVVRIVE